MGRLLVARSARQLPLRAHPEPEELLSALDRLPTGVVPATVASLPIAMLGVLSSFGVTVGVGVAVAAWAVTVVVTLPRALPWRELRYVALVGALLFAAATSDNGIASDLFAGLAGLGLLAYVTYRPGAPWRTGSLANGLLLPGMAFAVALLTALAIPADHQYVGLAAALLVAVFLLIAFLFRVLGAPTETVPSAS